MKLGLISDTHGLLRPAALNALRGSGAIIHAGDVGRLEILHELRSVAPLTAVRGNIDPGGALPETALVELAGVSIYVLHDLKELNLNPGAAGIGIVVHGHSHRPSREERGGVLYVNPGSAGPRRFRLPITVARLDLKKLPWRVQFIELEA